LSADAHIIVVTRRVTSFGGGASVEVEVTAPVIGRPVAVSSDARHSILLARRRAAPTNRNSTEACSAFAHHFAVGICVRERVYMRMCEWLIECVCVCVCVCAPFHPTPLMKYWRHVTHQHSTPRGTRRLPTVPLWTWSSVAHQRTAGWAWMERW
jgi:hypothetical protein